MRKIFDIQHERDYYKEAPTKLAITPDHIVESQMYLCTGLKSWYSLFNQKRVLEVGAGECSYLKYLLKITKPYIYIVQDIFAERMLIAKNVGQYPKVEYVGSDVLQLPFKNQSFDLCMAFGLLHHIPNVEEALAEIARILKVGGKFIFRDPCGENPIIWLKYKFGHKSHNEFPLYRRKIVPALEKAGFNILHINRFWLRFPKLPPGPWSVNIGCLALKTS